MNSDGQLVELTARLPVGPATSDGHVIVTVGEPSGAIGTAGLFTRAFDLALATAALVSLTITTVRPFDLPRRTADKFAGLSFCLITLPLLSHTGSSGSEDIAWTRLVSCVWVVLQLI